MKNKNRGIILVPLLILGLFITTIAFSYFAKDDLAYYTSPSNLAATLSSPPSLFFRNSAPAPVITAPMCEHAAPPAGCSYVGPGCGTLQCPQDQRLEIQKVIEQDQGALDKNFADTRTTIDKLLTDTVRAADLVGKTDKKEAVTVINSIFDKTSYALSKFSGDVISSMESNRKVLLDKIAAAPSPSPTPIITSISPNPAKAEDLITIKGNNFAGKIDAGTQNIFVNLFDSSNENYFLHVKNFVLVDSQTLRFSLSSTFSNTVATTHLHAGTYQVKISGGAGESNSVPLTIIANSSDKLPCPPSSLDTQPCGGGINNQNPGPAKISSISPTTIRAGDRGTIRGNNLTGTSMVRLVRGDTAFNSTLTKILSISSDGQSLTFQLGSGVPAGSNYKINLYRDSDRFWTSNDTLLTIQ